MSSNSGEGKKRFEGEPKLMPVLIVGYCITFNDKGGEPFLGLPDGCRGFIIKGPDGEHNMITKTRPNFETGTSRVRTVEPATHRVNVQEIGRNVELCEVPWGGIVHSIAREVLQQFVDDFDIHAFLVRPSPDGPCTGLITVRLSKLSQGPGLPDNKLVEKYAHRYRKRLEEVGATGEIPNSLSLEVLAMYDT